MYVLKIHKVIDTMWRAVQNVLQIYKLKFIIKLILF